MPGGDGTPYIGALLRAAHQERRRRMLAALAEKGFEDVNEAHFALFQLPPPDGERPSDLARRNGMSKQAMNHLLGQLEKLGYLERRRERADSHPTVHLTDRGWQVMESNIDAMLQLEADWERQIGKRRFAELKEALRELTGIDSPEKKALAGWGPAK
jgi:DNA-binding MarR family transcriptional regulator